MEIKLKSKEDLLKDIDKYKSNSGGGKFISESGLYKVAIKRAAFTTASTGAKKFSLNVVKDGSDSEQIINLGVVYKADGSENDFAMAKLASLLTLYSVGKIQTQPVKLTGFDGREIEAEEIKELAGKKLFIQVQREYSGYNGKIYRNLNLVDSFRLQDEANADEILNNKNLGKRYAWLRANPEKISKDKFRDITQEEVEAYYAAKKAEKANDEQRLDGGSDSNEEMPF
jgi:hypothetical protein